MILKTSYTDIFQACVDYFFMISDIYIPPTCVGGNKRLGVDNRQIVLEFYDFGLVINMSKTFH